MIVVIPCSREKRWHTEPALGPLPARRVYTSPLHHAAQAFARDSGAGWLVLSALHGLLRPDDLVPTDYDVTFSRPDDPVIEPARLALQALDLGLCDASLVVCLCPDDYTARLREAMGPRGEEVQAPLTGYALDDLAAMTATIIALPRPIVDVVCPSGSQIAELNLHPGVG